MKELIEKIDTFCAPWWWVIAAAFLLMIVILIVVVKVKNKRIRKLKQQLKATKTELETARTVSIGRGQSDADKANEANKPTQPPVILRPQPVQPEPYSNDALQEQSAQSEQSAAAEYAATVDEPDDYGEVTDEEDAAARSAPTVRAAATPVSDAVKYTVVYDRLKESWIVKKDGQARVVRRVNTKEEAMQIVRELVRKNANASLVVHKKDGKFQKH